MDLLVGLDLEDGRPFVGPGNDAIARAAIWSFLARVPPAADLATRKNTRPKAFGLFDPVREHDACGVGFIVDLKNRPQHSIVQRGLALLENLEHRGAVGADPLMGDGAGIMVQIPHAFFSAEAKRAGFALPAPGMYAVSHIFMPKDATMRSAMEKIVEQVIVEEGQVFLGWRDVPVDNSGL